MKKVLVSHWLSDDLVSEFQGKVMLDYPSKEKKHYTSEELKSRVKGHEGLLVAEVEVGKDVIDAGDSLEVIGGFGAGYNSIDYKYAGEKGIYVTNAPQIGYVRYGRAYGFFDIGCRKVYRVF